MPTATTPPGMIDVTIDGRALRVPAGTSVFDAARMNGISIPTLCHLQNQTPVGVCRLCVVDTGARVLTASCVRPVEPGLNVVTNSEKVLGARKTLLELMMADHPSPCTRQLNSGDCELETLRSEEHTSELQSPCNLVCRLLLEKKNQDNEHHNIKSLHTDKDSRNGRRSHTVRA